MKRIFVLLLTLLVLTVPVAWADAGTEMANWTGIRELLPDPERYGEAWIALTESGKVLSTDTERSTWAGSWQQRTADWRDIERLQTAHEDYTVLFGIDSDGVLHVCDPLDSNRQTHYVQANGWENVVQMDNRQDLICAVLADGSLRVNGSAEEDRFAPYWELSKRWSGLRQVHFLKTGGLVALGGDGRVWYYGPWPCYDYEAAWSNRELTESGEQVEQVLERFDGLLFCRRDGSVRIAARADWADDGLFSELEGWTDVAALFSGGGNAVYGLRTDGTVMQAGGIPQTETWTEITALACAAGHVIGLRENGTVLACGEDGSGQCKVSDWRNITTVYAGDSLSLGLDRDGNVLLAGRIG